MKPRLIQIDQLIEYNSEGGSFMINDSKLYFSLGIQRQITSISIMINGQLFNLQLTQEEVRHIEEQIKLHLLVKS